MIVRSRSIYSPIPWARSMARANAIRFGILLSSPIQHSPCASMPLISNSLNGATFLQVHFGTNGCPIACPQVHLNETRCASCRSCVVKVVICLPFLNTGFAKQNIFNRKNNQANQSTKYRWTAWCIKFNRIFFNYGLHFSCAFLSIALAKSNLPVSYKESIPWYSAISCISSSVSVFAG